MERWSSRLGFVFAATAAAVGLGNVWRFPAVVGQHGGGAYLVPYLVAVVALAVPLLVLELGVGRALHTDVVSAFRAVRPGATALGWVVVGTVIVVLGYYLVLTGWVLAYLVSGLQGDWLVFRTFTGSTRPVAYFAAAALVTGGVVSLGVRDGIERMATVAVPAMVLVVAALAAYAATLPGFGEAVAYLVTPDPSVLADPAVWAAAIGQVFFSLSVGQGTMMTFGSYLDDDVDILGSSAAIAAADVAVAFAAGFVIFPIVYTVGLEPSAGAELAFTTLPRAFAEMTAGRIVGVAFFGLLAVAAVSSAVALLEVGVAAVGNATGLARRRATMGVLGGTVLIGLPAALSYSAVGLRLGDRPVLDAMDGTVGTYGLPVTALLIVAVFVWLRPRRTVEEELPHRALYPVLAYLVPAALAVTVAARAAGSIGVAAWGLRAAGSLAPSVAAAVTVGVLAVLAAVGLVLARTLRRGRRPR